MHLGAVSNEEVAAVREAGVSLAAAGHPGAAEAMEVDEEAAEVDGASLEVSPVAVEEAAAGGQVASVVVAAPKPASTDATGRERVLRYRSMTLSVSAGQDVEYGKPRGVWCLPLVCPANTLAWGF